MRIHKFPERYVDVSEGEYVIVASRDDVDLIRQACWQIFSESSPPDNDYSKNPYGRLHNEMFKATMKESEICRQ